MMNNSIQISEHYNNRFRERIARTKRVEKFANDAFEYGTTLNEVNDIRLQKYLKNISAKYHHICDYRIYKGFVHVFDVFTMTAITVYRVPKKYVL